MIIYTITHMDSGKCYVGQTTGTTKERWRKHKAAKANTAISHAIRKYGVEAFDFAEIDLAETIEQLNYKESFWIAHLNTIAPNGYNLVYGGNNAKRSDVTRERMAAARIGKKDSPEKCAAITAGRLGYVESPEGKAHMEKLVAMHKGSKHTDEHKAKIAAAGVGRKHTEEAKRKIGEANARRVFTDEMRENYSRAQKGSVQTPESNAKRSETLKGRVITEEHRLKISEGRKLYFKKLKELPNG